MLFLPIMQNCAKKPGNSQAAWLFCGQNRRGDSSRISKPIRGRRLPVPSSDSAQDILCFLITPRFPLSFFPDIPKS